MDYCFTRFSTTPPTPEEINENTYVYHYRYCKMNVLWYKGNPSESIDNVYWPADFIDDRAPWLRDEVWPLTRPAPTGPYGGLAKSLIGSPIDVHIYDSENRHVGVNYATRMVENEIPDVALYFDNDGHQHVKLNPSEDNYRIEVRGTENGTYFFGTAFFDNGAWATGGEGWYDVPLGWNEWLDMPIMENETQSIPSRPACVLSPKVQQGLAGKTLTYAITITNLENIKDNFTLTAEDNLGWSLTLSENSFSGVQPGENRTAILSITVPTDKSLGIADVIAVKTAGTRLNAVAICVARRPPVFTFVSPSSQANLPGSALGYTVTVANEGIVEEKYDLSASDVKGWKETAVTVKENVRADAYVYKMNPDNNYGSSTNLWIGEMSYPYRSFLKFNIPTGINVISAELFVRFHLDWGIPYGASCCKVENDNWLENEITWNNCPAILDVLDSHNIVGPWDSWDVTEFVKSQTIDGVASFALKAASGGWGDYYLSRESGNIPYLEIIYSYVSLAPSVLTIPPGENRTATLTVTIPDNATIGTQDAITVTATSWADPTVSDNVSCIARVMPENTFLLHLVAGWNLVGFTRVGENDTPNSLFAPLVYNGDYFIYHWNAPGGPYALQEPNTAFKDNTGYWVDMINTNKTVYTTGAMPASENIRLVTGWNMVSFPVTNESTIPNKIFAPLVFNVDYIMYYWNAPGGPFVLVDPVKPLQDNLGYWVDMFHTNKTIPVP